MPAVLTDAVEAFETALDADPAADLAGFLPPLADPDFSEVLTELVRVDMERTWAGGAGRSLSDYRGRFPGALTGDHLQAVAFEEFRQRRLAGQVVLPAEYAARYAVDVTGWDDLSIDSSVWVPAASVASRPDPSADEPPATRTAAPDPVDPASVSRWVHAGHTLPQVGDDFLGLRLVDELGRGAFGRVYLARQNDLAGRPVAVKVAWNIAAESHTLAQLQHTNIVPVYSFHRHGQLQAVVMPFFGRTTLARVIRQVGGRPSLPASGRELLSTLDVRAEQTVGDGAPATPVPMPAADALPPDGWLKLDGLSYVGAVLSLAAELADGLAHAHARGILHRDLKPANVLLTDEGRPMLLDFNLAEDTKLRGSAAGAGMGGTLPYMAPEQLRAFAKPGLPLDGRADVYSLGVVLFELLTGRHPFPASSKATVEQLLAGRAGESPRLRSLNPAVSPATEAIVRQCLAADPADRYLSAAHLRDDLQRQLADQPLKHAPEPSQPGAGAEVVAAAPDPDLGDGRDRRRRVTGGGCRRRSGRRLRPLAHDRRPGPVRRPLRRPAGRPAEGRRPVPGP